jgi:hypothetical protein
MSKVLITAVVLTVAYVAVSYTLVVRPFFCDPSHFEELLVLGAAFILSGLLFAYNFVFSKDLSLRRGMSARKHK